MNVTFVDNRLDEIWVQWQGGKCFEGHVFLGIIGPSSVESMVDFILMLAPDAIAIGHNLGHPDVTGSHVIRELRARGWKGFVIANSGGGKELFERDGIAVDASADRDPHKLKQALDSLQTRTGETA